jgi:type II secretory pathway pseudopilin PulG
MENREQGTGNRERASGEQGLSGEQGFMLLGLIVAIFLILLTLSVAATSIAFSLRREREEEAVRRGNQYVRAIQLYYRKNQHYPGSIEQLENTNNIRYLRKRYIDPMTGKDDWRMIAVGQNKTTVKGFFGEPLAGIASTGLGSAAGISSGLGGSAGASTTAVGATGATTTTGGSAAGGSTAGAAGGASATGSTDSGFGGSSSLGSASGMANTSGFGSMSGSTGPIMGVGLGATGNSVITPNEQTTYQSWEFLYDPRIEKLKAAAALNSGLGSTGQSTNGFGQTPSGFGSSTSSGTSQGTGTPQTPPQP